jgi:hypothetical protein
MYAGLASLQPVESHLYFTYIPVFLKSLVRERVLLFF